MNKQANNKIISNENTKAKAVKTLNKKRWVVLGSTAIALLLIPRRSSQKTEIRRENGANINRTIDDSNKNLG